MTSYLDRCFNCGATIRSMEPFSTGKTLTCDDCGGLMQPVREEPVEIPATETAPAATRYTAVGSDYRSPRRKKATGR